MAIYAIEESEVYQKLVTDFIATNQRPPNDLDKMTLTQMARFELLQRIKMQLDTIETKIDKLVQA